MAFFGKAARGVGPAAPIDFNREIRPILAQHCFPCHGFDAKARKASLRLDVREEALKGGKSGVPAVVAGRSGSSEVLRRVESADPAVRMPPPEARERGTLSAAQVAKLRSWIDAGAVYAGHWAFEPVRRPQLPDVRRAGWAVGAIDTFVLAAMEARGLEPAPEAGPAVLARRLTLDLTGLPPAVGRSDETGFPGAYERLVESLLASPRHGERLAQDWLDAARYADSNGYQVDRDREMWAWRDWVVAAFNGNMPFDRFTVDQMAGDLVEHPTLEQRIATGFHRNHMINEEGGIIPEEFLAEYTADRVETTATVWLGQTFNCARCHDHKYDPFSQRDFYAMLAFFHNITEKGVGDYGASIRRNTPPYLPLPSPLIEGRIAALKAEAASVERDLAGLTNGLSTDLESWAQALHGEGPRWTSPRLLGVTVQEQKPLQPAADGWVAWPPSDDGLTVLTFSFERGPDPWTALRLEWETDSGSEPPQGAGIAPGVSELKLTWFEADRAAGGASTGRVGRLRPVAVRGGAGLAGLQSAVDGKDDTAWGWLSGERAAHGVFLVGGAKSGAAGSVELRLKLRGGKTAAGVRMRVLTTVEPADRILPSTLESLAMKPHATWLGEDRSRLVAFRIERSPLLEGLADRQRDIRKRIEEAELSIPITLVMEEMPLPRATHLLMRGVYDRPGERIGASTPVSLPPMRAEWPTNRLGLAYWLVARENPLTSRVMVNRLWQLVFGTGLVRTPEDFGVQGEAPSHPGLLEWLAAEFMDSGWDVRRMIRLMVTSATYRQDSRWRGESARVDPENRWLARGGRHRLPAEALRDQALAAAGLLVERLGGPPVRPYHPPGLYEQVVAGSSASTYVQGTGEDLYRRTLYTYWKRSVPHPALLAFDVPFREKCTVRRSRTSTPLQALNLMNDPTYVEAARGLAQRMMREGGVRSVDRIAVAVRSLLGRDPLDPEQAILGRRYQASLESFRRDPAAATRWISNGDSARDTSLDPAELAACMMVATTLLNLDETLCRE